MRIAEDAPADAGRYCYPRAEIEVAFVLGADLPGENCGVADVLAATEALAPAIELIDSRILDWRIGLPDTIPDNASSARVLLGEGRGGPADGGGPGMAPTLGRDGAVVAHGRSDAVLGNPAEAVAWLARAVARY